VLDADLCETHAQVRKERDNAVKASESAYEASELLREQLSLVSREKDLACMQVCVRAAVLSCPHSTAHFYTLATSHFMLGGGASYDHHEVPTGGGYQVHLHTSHSHTHITHTHFHLRECQHCRKFFLESENIGSPCHWHPGVRGEGGGEE